MRKAILLYLMLIIGLMLFAEDAPRGWIKNLQQQTNVNGKKVVTDHEDNIWIAAEFDGEDGKSDIMVAKFDSLVEGLWYIPMGSSGYDRIVSMAADKTGNAYLCGYTRGSFYADTLMIDGENYFLRLNANGSVQWLLTEGYVDSGSFTSKSLTTDAEGNVYLVGSFEGKVNFSGKPQTSRGSSDIYIAKFDPNAKVLWEKTIGGNDIDDINDIIVTPSGEIYILGTFRGSITFFPNNTKTCVDKGDEWSVGDVYLGKLDKQGNWIWVKHFQSSKHDGADNLALDTDGNIIFSMSIEAAMQVGKNNFDPQELTSTILAKVDSQGNILWAQMQAISHLTALICAPDKSFYMSGWLTRDAVIGDKTLIHSGAEDILIAKFSPDGTLQQVEYGGAKNTDTCNDLAMDSKGNCFAIGTYSGEINLGGHELSTYVVDGEYPYPLSDLFLWKMSEN